MTERGDTIKLSRAKKILAPYKNVPEICKVFEATFKDNFIIVFFIEGLTLTLTDSKGLRLSYSLADAYDVLCDIGIRSFVVVRQPEPLEPRPGARQEDEPIDPPHPPDRPTFEDLDKLEASVIRLAATAGLTIMEMAQAMRSTTSHVGNMLELKYPPRNPPKGR
jgi:hypothetical protein